MDKKQLFDALEKRTSLRVVRRLLAQNGFPRGQGWDQIREKLTDARIEAKADFAGLESALRELLIVGTKGCRIYQLDDDGISTLRRAVASLKLSKSSVFSTHYPYPVPDNILAGLPAQPALPVAKFHSKWGHGVLFSSVQIIEVREKLSASIVGTNVANDYDEVIGIRKVKVQTFDAVIVSESNSYVFVLTDAFQDTSQSMSRALNVGVNAAIDKLAEVKIATFVINLLPIVEPLYYSGEGLIKSLEYTTTTSSGKNEWMRGSGKCLRQEASHKAGMAAISSGFQAYGIDIEWQLDEVAGYIPRPSLGIYGTYRMTYETNPEILDASIWGCATISDLDFVISEMVSDIPKTN